MDAGPLIEGFWPTSRDGARVRYYTVPAVVQSEIRDEATRLRLAQPGAAALELRTPTAGALAAVRKAAAAGGDAAVLSAVDVHLLALTWDLACEHGGVAGVVAGADAAPGSADDALISAGVSRLSVGGAAEDEFADAVSSAEDEPCADGRPPAAAAAPGAGGDARRRADEDLPGWGGEWATAGSARTHAPSAAPPADLPAVSCATTDYAMQNVLLRLGLAPLGPSGRTITALRSFLLRCHACFWTTLDTARRFCDRCGGPTLLRASYSLRAGGEREIHLQRGRVWNVRGTVAPLSYRSNLARAGDHAGGAVLLREDQKEYVRAMASHRRAEKKASAHALLDDPDAHAAPSVPLPAIGFGRRNPNASRRTRA